VFVDSDNIVLNVLDATKGQRMYLTNSGYMGLAHNSCMVGDKVYLLMGSDMLFMLQKRSTGGFQFLDEAYVHGIMDGEFLLKLRDLLRDEKRRDLSDDEWLGSLGEGELPFDVETLVLT